MRAAGFPHPLAKARLLAKLLDHAHAVDHFVETVINIGEISPHTTDYRRAVTLIDNHHHQHRRENQDRHQRHAPVETEHCHQHRANQGRAAQNCRDYRDIQIADHFGIVGDARNELPDGLRVKFTQRLTQRGIHHVGTQLLHHADRSAVKQQRLSIVQTGGENLQPKIGGNESGHPPQRQIIFSHHVVDEVAYQ